MKIDIITVGRLKNGPFLDLWNEYSKRLTWSVNLVEVEGRTKDEENIRLAEKLSPRAYSFVLDEHGKSLPSRALAQKFDNLMAEGQGHVQFVIGGADGLEDSVRQRADFLLSFGDQTWPHKLVRVMLIEQIYRASQIIAGHPYHRD